VKAVDVHTFTKQAKKFKINTVCQKGVGNCLLGQERRADGVIHATRDNNNIRSVLRYTKILVGPLRKKAWNADIRCSVPA
jgi:hypothetical protein